MKLRSLALAALAATSISAQAGLTSYAPWDAAYTANGLGGVQFNVQTNGGATVALGAHAYRNGATLANNGTDTFYAQSGVYGAGPDPSYANWSFDFAWNLGTNCSGCTVHLLVDKDPTAAAFFVDLFTLNAGFAPLITASQIQESWNMEMVFMTGLVYDFNPYAPSSTGFALQVLDGNNALVVGSDITVNVPEPESLALVGLALAGLAITRRRRKV